MKIWVSDSQHEPPNMGWIRLYTAFAAKGYLRGGKVQEMALDFDFGGPSCPGKCHDEDSVMLCNMKCACRCHHRHNTGVDLLRWMSEQPGRWPTKKLWIITQNPLAFQLMQNLVVKHAPKKLQQGVCPDGT